MVFSTGPKDKTGVRLFPPISAWRVALPPSVPGRFCATMLGLTIALFSLSGAVSVLAEDTADSSSNQSNNDTSQTTSPTDNNSSGQPSSGDNPAASSADTSSSNQPVNDDNQATSPTDTSSSNQPFSDDNQATSPTDTGASDQSGNSQSATSTGGSSNTGMTTAAAEAQEKQLEDPTTDTMSEYGLWIPLALIFGLTILVAAISVLVVFLAKRNQK